MRPRRILLHLAAVLPFNSIALADEEYDRLKDRLQAEMKSFYDDQKEIAKKVGWTKRSLPPTPEQSRAMRELGAFRDSPRFKFRDEFLAFAEKHRGTQEAMEAWAMVLTMARCSSSEDGYLEHPETTLAFQRLIDDHASDPEIVKAMDVVRRNGRCLRFESLEYFYKTIECRSYDPEIVARTRFARAEMFQDPWRFRGPGRTLQRNIHEKALDDAAADEILRGLVRDLPQTSAGIAAEGELFRKEHLADGRKLPDFEGNDLGGKLIGLSQFRGRVVMVVFWASWCGPCMERIPEEREMAEKFADRPFTILGVNCDRTTATFKKVMAREALPWPNIFDGDPKTGPIVNALRVNAFPTVILLDHEGVIRHQRLYGEQLEKAISELVEKVPTSKEPSASQPVTSRMESPPRP